MYNNELLKQRLLSLNIFTDNEYFKKYLEIVVNNSLAKPIKGYTQRHHIIPKSYFKIKNLPADNSASNVVNLYYNDHVKAHCLLSLCSIDDDFKLKNNFAVYKLLGVRHIEETELNKIDFDLLQELYEQNKELRYINQPMHKASVKVLHLQRMQSAEVREAISITMQKIRAQTQNYIYIHKERIAKRIPPEQLGEYLKEGWVEGTIKGRMRIYKDGHETTIWPEQWEMYEKKGWHRGGLPGRMTKQQKEALANSHKNRFNTIESREVQRNKLKTFYINNPDWTTRSKHPVKLYNDENIVYFFKTTREAEIFIGLSGKALSQGLLRKSFASGYVELKKSKFYKWHIEKCSLEEVINNE